MAMRQHKKKKDSDDEADQTPQERKQIELESAETIRDDEVSPAAFVFENSNTQQDDLNLFEDK